MNEQKAEGMIGLAVRARQAVAGSDACRIMVRTGKCGVMLMDEETGASSRAKAEELCRKTKTPLVILPAGLIEKATGMSNRVMAIRTGSFAEQILAIAGVQ